MKTIKQIADEIGASKQAVQKRVAREPLCTSLYPYLHTKDGTKYIDEAGEKIIKKAFNKTVSASMSIDESIDASIDKSDGKNELYKILKTELESKNAQIAEQQRTINKLMDRLADAQQSGQAAQILHAGTIQKHLPTDSDLSTTIQDFKKPTRFFARWFKKNE